jgi:hypothetical protein
LRISSEKTATPTLRARGRVASATFSAKRGLSHAGSARDDEELGALEARGHLVELLEPGGQADDALATPRRLLHLLDGAVDDVLDVLVGRAAARLADLEDTLLRVVEVLLGLAVVAVAGRRDLVARGDEAPDVRLLTDDVRVLLDVRDGGDRVREREQVLVTTGLVEVAPIDEPAAQGDGVDGLPAPEELRHRVEDERVAAAVEVLGREQLEDGVQRAVLEEHAAEHGALGVERVRRNAASLARRSLGHLEGLVHGEPAILHAAADCERRARTRAHCDCRRVRASQAWR